MTATLEAPTRLVPWLGVGTDVSRAATAQEAARLSGLDFDVSLRRMAYWDSGDWKEDPDRVRIVRDDTGARFGIASPGYEPVQYDEAFGFVDAMTPHFVAAGPLRGGRQGFMVVQTSDDALRHLDLEVRGQGDRHGTFVVMRTSHDLSRGIELTALMLRYSCTNQITGSAFAKNAPWRWSIRHVRGAREQLEQAQRVLTNVGAFRDAFAETARQLAAIELTIDEAREILTQVLGTPRSRPKTAGTVERILGAWQSSPTVGFFPTGWGLVNALGEDIDWNRHLTASGKERGGARHEARFLGALQGANLKYTGRTAHLLLRQRG